ncbi:hypothetical protein ACLOJK_011792 [Asimina triloba]
MMNVQIISRETIDSSPHAPRPSKYKINVLDRALPPVYIPLILFCHSAATAGSRVERLKKSLSVVPTRFFPLDGRAKEEKRIDPGRCPPLVLGAAPIQSPALINEWACTARSGACKQNMGPGLDSSAWELVRRRSRKMGIMGVVSSSVTSPLDADFLSMKLILVGTWGKPVWMNLEEEKTAKFVQDEELISFVSFPSVNGLNSTSRTH